MLKNFIQGFLLRILDALRQLLDPEYGFRKAAYEKDKESIEKKEQEILDRSSELDAQHTDLIKQDNVLKDQTAAIDQRIASKEKRLEELRNADPKSSADDSVFTRDFGVGADTSKDQ